MYNKSEEKINKYLQSSLFMSGTISIVFVCDRFMIEAAALYGMSEARR
jgi:hypothetical protein